MNSEDKAFTAGMIISSIIWVGILTIVGLGIGESWKADCVERGYARYNPGTADFEWVEPETTFQKTLDKVEADSTKALEADVDAYMKRICP